jgi:predicted nucleic acid-binding protein
VVGVLFDTCILVDRLRGVDAARIEILAGGPARAEPATRRFLAQFTTIPLDDDIAECTVAIRRETRLKPPDALILATALGRRMMLVTRDEKAFGPERPGVRMPYRV